MTPREAIRVLMLSPCYFKMFSPAERWALIKEFCVTHQGSMK